MLMSCFRLLTTNVFQLLRGTPVKRAAEIFKELDRKAIMDVVISVMENPPETEGGSTIAQGALRLFTTSLDVLFPSVGEKCALLVKYLDNFVKGTLSNLQRSVLEILLRQMSKPSALANMINGNDDSGVTDPSVLLASLLSIARMETVMHLKSIAEHVTRENTEGHHVGEAAVQMLSSLCNMILSQGSQSVILSSKAGPGDAAASAATGTTDMLRLGDEKGSSGKIIIQMLLQMLEASGEILKTALATNDELNSTRQIAMDGEEVQPILDEELDDVLRISPVGTLLPIIVNATSMLIRVPALGAQLLSCGLASISTPLASCLTNVQKCIPMLPQKLAMVSQNDASSQKASEVIESAHPYASNTDVVFPFSFPGAVRLTFIFDEQSKTENNYDYVKIWKTEEKSETYHPETEKYTGRGTAVNS